jgi:hypothetical protein
MESPTLISLDYTKNFYIFSFASYDMVVAVLLQKDDESLDHPVAFFRKTLRDVELRYDLIEKQAYALIKSLNLSEFISSMQRLSPMFLHPL